MTKFEGDEVKRGDETGEWSSSSRHASFRPRPTLTLFNDRLLQVRRKYHRLSLQQRRVRPGSRAKLDELGRSLLGARSSRGALPSCTKPISYSIFSPTDRDSRSCWHAHREEEGLGRSPSEHRQCADAVKMIRTIDYSFGNAFAFCRNVKYVPFSQYYKSSQITRADATVA